MFPCFHSVPLESQRIRRSKEYTFKAYFLCWFIKILNAFFNLQKLKFGHIFYILALWFNDTFVSKSWSSWLWLFETIPSLLGNDWQWTFFRGKGKVWDAAVSLAERRTKHWLKREGKQGGGLSNHPFRTTCIPRQRIIPLIQTVKQCCVYFIILNDGESDEGIQGFLNGSSEEDAGRFGVMTHNTVTKQVLLVPSPVTVSKHLTGRREEGLIGVHSLRG